ncbi:MAG: RNA 2',3'-cyclic phosphodiesterase [Nitrosomonas sp.]|nr:RNA 2',3'-cyclic phosphodiesterase [Nitrosomonas sp.]
MSDIIRRETARLFFAIRPDSTIQAVLNRMARKVVASEQDGRCVKPENIHLTVLFLGDVESDRIDTLREIAGSVVAQTFSLSIQGTLFWKKNRIVMANVAHYPAALFALAGTLKTALVAAGFTCEDRKYKPHITLIRKAGAHLPMQLENPIQWDVDDWLLLQSRLSSHGSCYSELGRWPLHSITETDSQF